MPRKPALFRQSDITKAIKGALKAGAKLGRVEVRPDGSFTIFKEEGASERTFPDAEIVRKGTS